MRRAVRYHDPYEYRLHRRGKPGDEVVLFGRALTDDKPDQRILAQRFPGISSYQTVGSLWPTTNRVLNKFQISISSSLCEPLMPPTRDPGRRITRIEPLLAGVLRQQEVARTLIQQKWQSLGGSPGAPQADVEPAGDGFRIRYEHGAIYARPDMQCFWVYGAIGVKYDETGGPTGWLGLPRGDEIPFSEGGRVSIFDKGAIYWWADTGAIDMNAVSVRYMGLVCYGETDTDGVGSDSDEPYVSLGLVTPNGSLPAVQSQIYSDVDGGESRPDFIELYRGLPNGLLVLGQLIEHDEGDPDKYLSAMNGAVGALFGAVKIVIPLIPVVGAFLGPVAGPLLDLADGPFAELLNSALGTGDDNLGTFSLNITPKMMVVFGSRTPESTESGVAFKLASPLLNGEGASYKVFFSLAAV